MSATRQRVARGSFLAQGRSRLFVREIGQGHPVVVLHGGPDFDHRYLLPELDSLASEARLIYYDQRGRGASCSGEGAADVTLATEMQDLEAVRASSGAASVAVLGHSFGSLLAAEYATRFSERVSHLVLMNPAPISRAGVEVFRAALAARRTPTEITRIRELAADPAYLAGSIEPEAEYHRIHFRSTVRSSADLDAVVGRLRLAFTPASILAARAIEASLYAETWDRATYDLRAALGDVRIPTLVILGDNDFIPPEIGRGIAAAIPNARAVEFADCGHFAFVDRPEAVRSSIAELLRASAA